MKRIFSIIMLCTTCFANAEGVEQDVAINKYNTFVFDKPYKKAIAQPGSPIDEPLPLDGNNGFLLRVNGNSDKPFQLIVELVNGETVDFYLTPKNNAQANTYRRNKAGTYSEPEGQRARPSDTWIIEVMKAATLQKTPVGFMEEGKPHYAQSGDTYLVPVKKLTNNLYELLIFELRSDTAKNVQPRDFWHEGVEAIQIDGDIVSPHHRPIIFILREVI